MPKNIITEDHIEQEALKILEEEGYNYIYAPTIAPVSDGGNNERKRYSDVVLVDRLREALEKINPPKLLKTLNVHKSKTTFFKMW